MRNLKLIAIILTIAILLWLVPAIALAQEEVPAPYTGVKNPFPWGDSATQQTGKGIYQQSCLGCHGVKGNNVSKFDFSSAAFSKNIEGKADFYFWVVSEGRLTKGMPPYKSSLSEEKRWQVLTYLWSLGAAPSTTAPPPSTQPPPTANGALSLTVPQQAKAGQPITITATLSDINRQPIPDATVTFFFKLDFFASGLMQIGEAVTSDKGLAVLEYTPRESGNIRVVAQYQGIEGSTTIDLDEADRPFYQAEAGLRLPAPGEEIFIGPQSATDIGTGERAPTSALRLPGGVLSWLLFLVLAVMLIWFTYARILYQVFRIPIVSEIRDIDTRLVPTIGLTIVITIGIILTLKLITGPYTHFNLLR
ncbi:MAG: c-type cytochrome [Chloroflexi bacterium]|nr:c-type cytochrome [Chloroflexota bacterium]